MNKSFVEGLKPNPILRDIDAMKRVVGWEMKPEDVFVFFKSLRKQVISLFGFSTAYQDSNAMLEIARNNLKEYSPETHLVNIGATEGGIGAVYPLAKSLGFTTTGIVSNLAVQYAEAISPHADHICFVSDSAWGGKVAGSESLTPTSQAMVACTDIFIGIGGGEITRDELLAGEELGKPVKFFPAEMKHEIAIERAMKKGLPIPASYWGAAHEVMMKK